MSSVPPCPGVLRPLCLNTEASSLSGSLWGVAHSCLQASWDSTHSLVTLANPIRKVAVWHLVCPTERLGSITCRPSHHYQPFAPS